MTTHRANWTFGLVGLVLTAALVIPGQTLAASEPAGARLAKQVFGASDPQAAFNRLSDSQQAILTDFETVAYTTESESVEPQATTALTADVATASSCWTWTWNRQGWNNVGQLLWQFNQQIDWCSNGSTITTVPFRKVWASGLYVGWSYLGLINNQVSGGLNYSYYRSFVQGDMALGIGGWWLQHKYPWLDMTAHANGTGTGSGGQ